MGAILILRCALQPSFLVLASTILDMLHDHAILTAGGGNRNHAKMICKTLVDRIELSESGLQRS